MSVDDLTKLSAFLVDLEDLCKARGIGYHEGITLAMEGCGGWYCVCNFEVGRPSAPPDLGVSVSDGMGLKDEVK